MYIYITNKGRYAVRLLSPHFGLSGGPLWLLKCAVQKIDHHRTVAMRIQSTNNDHCVTCEHTCLHTYILTFTDMYTHFTHICTYVHTPPYTHTYIPSHEHMCIHIRMYQCIVQVHTYIHTVRLRWLRPRSTMNRKQTNNRIRTFKPLKYTSSNSSHHGEHKAQGHQEVADGR